MTYQESYMDFQVDFIITNDAWEWFDEAINFISLLDSIPHMYMTTTCLCRSTALNFMLQELCQFLGFVSEDTLGLEASYHVVFTTAKKINCILYIMMIL